MRMRIAVISTHHLNAYIEPILAPYSAKCDIDFFLIDNYEECVNLFAAIQDKCDGFFVSDILFRRAIETQFPHIHKPIYCYNVDYVGYFRIITLLLVENRALEFDRLFIDFVDYIPSGMMENLIRNETLIYLHERYIDLLLHLDTGDIARYQEQQIQRIRKAFDDNLIDLVITSQCALIAPLQAMAIPYRFAYPNERLIREGIEKLIEHLDFKISQRYWPAVIHVSYQPTPDTPPCRGADQQLEDALLQFAQQNSFMFSPRNRHRHLEILTSSHVIEAITDSYAECRLSHYLKGVLPDAVSIGYGFGKDILSAQYAASCAHHEASRSAVGGSFAIDIKERLIGPLQPSVDIAKAIADEAFIHRKAEITGLSQSIVRRLCEYITSTGHIETTAQELASSLDISQRTANRVLAKLKDAGEAEHAQPKSPNCRGRPGYLYRLFPKENLSAFR